MPRRRLIGLAALVATGLLFLGTRAVFAAFSGSTTNSGNVFKAKKVFPGNRATSDWTIRDASAGGAEATSDDALSYNEGTTVATGGNWSSSFASTRYLEFDFSAPEPVGLAVTAATFDFRFADNSASPRNTCFYFEVRRISTGAVLGTHGSSGSTLGCVTGTTLQTFSTSIAAEVTTTDIANDLRIRVFQNESGNGKTKTDMATASVTTSVMTATQYEVSYADAANGSAATTKWSLAVSGDSATFTSTANWGAYSTSKYLKFSFPAELPSGAIPTSVTLNHTYKASAGGTLCYYFEVYNSTTLLATHGSSGALTAPPAVSCTGTTFKTDNVSLTEVDTDSKANNLVIKMYFAFSASGKSVQDLLTVTINWYLD